MGGFIVTVYLAISPFWIYDIKRKKELFGCRFSISDFPVCIFNYMEYSTSYLLHHIFHSALVKTTVYFRLFKKTWYSLLSSEFECFCRQPPVFSVVQKKKKINCKGAGGDQSCLFLLPAYNTPYHQEH